MPVLFKLPQNSEQPIQLSRGLDTLIQTDHIVLLYISLALQFRTSDLQISREALIQMYEYQEHPFHVTDISNFVVGLTVVLGLDVADMLCCQYNLFEKKKHVLLYLLF